MRHASMLPALLALAAFGPALCAAAEPPRPPQGAPEPPPRKVVQSAEDRGFAIALVSPTEPWLNGRQAIRIDAIIPRDDAVEQVDFFVDRKLVFVDTDEPYAHTFDFGDEIRRHTIEVKALTKEGRRARVSFVSRSVDLSENARGRVITLTAMVRDAAGRPVDRLDVSDFRLTEAGVPQPIVHFLAGPTPASMAVVVDPDAWIETREGLQRFLRTLPGHQAVALLGAPGSQPPSTAPAAGAPDAAPPARTASSFTYDLAALTASMPRMETAPAEPPAETAAVARRAAAGPPPATLADRLGQAATALASRRGPRLLLLVAAVAPVGEEPFGPMQPADPAEAPRPKSAGGAHEPETPTADPLATALEEARRTGAAVHVIALPAPDGISWHQAKATARTLQEAVDASGGTWDDAPDAAGLERALGSISEKLRHQYVVSYVSGAGAGGWTPLEVGLNGREGTIEAPRAVYFAGDQPLPVKPAKEGG